MGAQFLMAAPVLPERLGFLERETIGYADRLLAAIQENTLATERMIAVLGGGHPGGASPAPKALPEFTIPVPVSPVILAQSVIAADLPAIAAIVFYREAFTVPGNGSYTLTLPVANTTALIFTSALRAVSDTYAPDLTASVVVDDVAVLLNAFPLIFEADGNMVKYGVVRKYATATFVNATASPIGVTVDTEYVLVREQDYDTIWRPILEGSYAVLEAKAKVLVASGVVSA